MIKHCKNKCAHDFQDGRYGKYNRVHTVSKKDEERCTVCHPSHMTKKMKAIAANWSPGFSK